MIDLSHVHTAVIHTSASTPDKDLDAAAIDRMHRRAPNHFRMIGYHFVGKRNGAVELGRHVSDQGAHVRGNNRGTLGYCMVGGLDWDEKPVDNYTPEQWFSLELWARGILAIKPEIEFVGHRDLSPDLDGDGIIERHEWLKECPCFDVKEKFYQLGIIGKTGGSF